MNIARDLARCYGVVLLDGSLREFLLPEQFVRTKLRVFEPPRAASQKSLLINPMNSVLKASCHYLPVCFEPKVEMLLPAITPRNFSKLETCDRLQVTVGFAESLQVHW